MDVVYPCCCGLDVHKTSITACVLWAEGSGRPRKEKRRFGTFTADLLELADWLRACGVTHIAMEATGVYWKPVWNILDGQFAEVLLVNAQHIKAVPGRKTDQKDSEWIADLLQHGLLRGSFVPPQPTRELRDLTRYRVSLSQECNRIANRIQKVLEDANLKLASVATDALGASGRAMLRAIIAGEQDVAMLANLAKGLLRNKIPALREALAGRVTEHHRFMLRALLDDLDHAEAKMTAVEQEIDRRLRPFQDDVVRLCTIPGVDRVTAWGLLSEIGFNMDQFPSAAHLASWAGMCPGNAESAGKRLSGKTRKGSAFLRRHLCQAGWAVSTKEELVSVGPLPTHRTSSWSQTRDHGRWPCHSRDRLPSTQAADDLYRSGSRLFRPSQRGCRAPIIGEAAGEPRPCSHPGTRAGIFVGVITIGRLVD